MRDVQVFDVQFPWFSLVFDTSLAGQGSREKLSIGGTELKAIYLKITGTCMWILHFTILFLKTTVLNVFGLFYNDL